MNHDMPDPSTRIDHIATAMELCGPDVSNECVDRVADCLLRAHERSGLDPDTTVVAFIGATGSGKSSLFNALLGHDIAQVGVRRPTTTQALAAIGAGTRAAEVVEWIGVRDYVLIPADAGLPDGVALVDLPDIDSIVSEHTELTKRLASRVDLLVWVVDPQKYADNVIHSHWIAPFADHHTPSCMVLTHTDQLSDTDRAAIEEDIHRLLQADRAGTTRVVGASAHTGEGIDAVRTMIAERAGVVREQLERVNNVLDEAVAVVQADLGLESGSLPAVPNDLTMRLVDTVCAAVRTGQIASAVGAAYRHRARTECGWLPFRVFARFQSDPLSRFHLETAGGSATSLPALSPAAHAELKLGMRELADDAAAGRPEMWKRRVRELARERVDSASVPLDHAVASTDLGVRRRRVWWRVSSWMQNIGWLAVLIGFMWILGVRVGERVLMVSWQVPMWRALAVPTWCMIGGVAVSAAIALVSWGGVRLGASRASARAQKALKQAIHDVVDRTMSDALVAECRRQSRIVEHLHAAQR